jgi:glucose/arabinose dehydrogenase
MMFANRITSSTSCSIWLPDTPALRYSRASSTTVFKVATLPVIRFIMHDGKAIGEYDDFMTGFVTDSGDVWGRPVGVALGHDGSLFVTEDAHGTVWRISYHASRAPGL